MDLYLLELRRYLDCPAVRRIQKVGSSEYVYAQGVMEAAWRVLAGDPDKSDAAARATAALELYAKLYKGPQFLTLPQFLKASSMPELICRKHKFQAQIELAGKEFEDFERIFEYDVTDDSVREEWLIPRCCLVGAVNGDLPIADPAE